MKKSKPEISDEAELNEAHNKKMQKIKEARDKMMDSKTAVSYTHLTLPTTPYV